MVVIPPAAAEAVTQLSQKLGLPSRLRDVGVPKEALEAIASATLGNQQLATNPKPIVDAGQIIALGTPRQTTACRKPSWE